MQRVGLQTIRTMAEAAREALAAAAAGAGRGPQIFLHWSAGHYGQAFADYHICIDWNGEIYAMADDLAAVLAHTWHRNTGAVGVAMLCCAFANTNDLGSEPPTGVQIETLAQVVAVLCEGLEIPCDAEHVRTHAEQADIDGYGPASTCERWDLWLLHNGDAPGTGGAIIRGKAVWYQQNGVGV